MATTIQTINDKKIFVNGKEVIKDIDGDWICKDELTPSETKAFQHHLNHL